jgi:excisionase family DNA binding protein
MLGEREFTTEEVAGYCGVTRPAVVSWIEQSLLPARRTAGGHRRVLRDDLARFLGHQGYVVPPEVSRVRPLLFVVEGDAAPVEVVAAAFAQDFEVQAWPASIDALLAIGSERPDVLVVTLPMAALDGARLLMAASRSAATASTLRAAVVRRASEVKAARGYGAELAFACDRLDALYRAVLARVSDRQRRQMV